MTLVLDIPEQKLQQAEAAAQANGKTLQQALEERRFVIAAKPAVGLATPF